MAKETGTGTEYYYCSSNKKAGCWKYFDKVVGSEQSEGKLNVEFDISFVVRNRPKIGLVV